MGDALPSFEEYSSSPLMRVNLPKPLDGRESILVSQTPRSLDFEALRQAVEKRDAYTLLGLYAVDAQVHAVNRNTPPSSPQVLRGNEQISEYLRQVCSREMSHQVKEKVILERAIECHC
jgi:hypothetical protein